MKRKRGGSTIKQYAYATRRLSGQGSSKMEIARLSGYSPVVARNAKAKIEDTEGYKNAVIVLAEKSNNLMLSVLTEFEVRGLKGFSNADLVKATNAITGAWERIEKVRAPDRMKDVTINRLRGVFTQRVETRTATVEAIPAELPPADPEPGF